MENWEEWEAKRERLVKKNDRVFWLTFGLSSLALAAIVALVLFGFYQKAHAQAPIRTVPILTPQEVTCEKITPRNQAQCAGPENKPQENCEQCYTEAKNALKTAEKARVPEVVTAEATESIANSLMCQNCVARNKR